jgi:hypothetical protein
LDESDKKSSINLLYESKDIDQGEESPSIESPAIPDSGELDSAKD